MFPWLQKRPSSSARTYTRACLLSWERSGTNLLGSMLNSHPDIVHHGELFNESKPSRQLEWKRLPQRLIGENEDFAPYLENFAYPPEPEGKRVVSFKLFPLQTVQNPLWHGLPRYLRDEGIRIMYLRRENLLDVFLSGQLARRSQKWYFVSPSEDLKTEYQKPIRLDTDYCITMFHIMENWHQFFTDFFPQDAVFPLTYRQIVTDPQHHLSLLYRWLDLPPHTVSNPRKIERQRRLPKHEVIANFEELRSRCISGNPKWSWMFDDDDAAMQLPEACDVRTSALVS